MWYTVGYQNLIWYSIAWNSTWRLDGYDIVLFYIMWYVMILHVMRHPSKSKYDVVRYDYIRPCHVSGMAEHYSAWFDILRYDKVRFFAQLKFMICYEMRWYNRKWNDLVRFDVLCRDMIAYHSMTCHVVWLLIICGAFHYYHKEWNDLLHITWIKII